MRLYLRRPPGQPTISKALLFLKQQSPTINFIIKPYGRLPGGQIPIHRGLAPHKGYQNQGRRPAIGKTARTVHRFPPGKRLTGADTPLPMSEGGLS